MLDLDWAPIVGALVITRKAWDETSPAGQAALRETGARVGERLRAHARKEVDAAVAALQKCGLVVTRPNAEQTQAWRKLAEGLYPRIRGRMVPAETFDEVVGLLKAYRAAKGK